MKSSNSIEAKPILKDEEKDLVNFQCV